MFVFIKIIPRVYICEGKKGLVNFLFSFFHSFNSTKVLFVCLTTMIKRAEMYGENSKTEKKGGGGGPGVHTCAVKGHY